MNKGYIHRDIENKLKKMVRQFPATAVTGPRQSGKTTLLKEIFSKKYNYVTFDDPIVREQAISDPRLFLEEIGGKAIIDEIQYVPEILSYVKMAIDNDRQQKGQYIFTGSQQFTLIKNLGDSLAGRIALLDLLPFAIDEKLKIPGLHKGLKSSLGCFVDSCIRGSFPEISVDRTVDRDAWYSSYLSTYLERDVRTIYNIGSLRDFQAFMQLLAGRCSQILNLSSFSNDLGVSVNTIKRWLSILEASRIIYLVPPYYRNFGKRFTKSSKVYFLDCGLVCYLVGIKTKELLLKGPMGGALFENFCIQETVKLFMNFGKRPSLYYYRSHNNLEVDIVIDLGGVNISIFEVKFSKTPKRKMASNLARFKGNFPKLKVSGSKVITLNDNSIRLTEDITSLGILGYLSHLSAS